MKTHLILCATVLFAVPAGAVTVTCVNEGSGVVRIDYDAASETALPIAFAIDITVDSGAVITSVSDYKVGDSTATSRGFGIFPSSLQIDEKGLVSDWGTPEMNPSLFPGVQPGLGTAGVTLGMASRYSGQENAPSAKGTLCRIRIDTGGAPGVNVRVAANLFGGGVVLEDARTASFTGVGCTLGVSAPSLPDVPASISYPSASSTGQYTVSWAASNGATSYQLDRSANGGSTWTPVYSGTALSYAETVPNGSYRYRVKAMNSAGSSLWRTGAGDCIVSISSPTPPAAPASISYPSTSSTGQYTVSWAASTGATSYQLDRSANGGSTWTPVYSGTALSYAETVPNGSYRYRVKAMNSAGSSLWRTGSGDCTVSISSPTVPAQPASISYPSTSSTGQYTVSWTASSGATSYELARSDNGGSWKKVYSGPNTSYAETVGNGKYRYRVKAMNSAGSSKWTTGSGDCTVSISSPTPPAAPASISYPSTSSTGQYTVSWAASTGATSYQLDRSANGGSTWTPVYSGTALSYAETVPNGSYRYRVKAMNSAGSSLWRTGSGDCTVSISSPTVPAQPASISYPSTSSTGQYTVSWAASSGATSYELARSDNGGSWKKVYSGPNTSYAETVGNGKYRYRVKAMNSAGSSQWTTGSGDCVVSAFPVPPSDTKILGNPTVLAETTTVANRRAAPYTMSEAGQLQSISIYHQGGSGRMILAVYGDSSGRPGTRLGLTSAVTIDNSEGWQTVALQSPVAVSSGQRIWLAWVFESNPGIRFTAGTPGRAESSATWSGGMPSTFGSSTVANYIYSIYATYRTGSSQ